jgi:hypothetical protein
MSGQAFTVPPKVYERLQSPTGFTAILDRLVHEVPGGVGVALVDVEGEAVDYAGDRVDPFEIKVAGAQWRILLQEIESGKLAAEGGAPRRIIVGTEKSTFVIEALPEGYALIALLHRNAPLAHVDRAFEQAIGDLHKEAGWPAPPEVKRWWPIDVDTDDEGRPTTLRLKSRTITLDVIGRIMLGLRRGETGYRVSIRQHQLPGEQPRRDEVTIVRGMDGRWYSDAPPGEIAG